MINLESDYEYVTGSIMGNIMNLQAEFSSMEWAKEDLETISKELVHTGKLFAAQQGLGGVSQIQDVSVNGTRVYINRKNRTGTLINSIKAEPNGNTVVFWNDANLGRGYYAGHIEYGFHDRGGNPIAARPFMRPAFQAVARASMGNISGTLYSFLQGNMIQNTTATFGTPLTSGGGKRAFYNQPTRGPNRGFYTVSGLRGRNAQSNWKGAISKLRDKGTVRDGGNRKGFIHTKDTLNKHGFTSFTTTRGKSKHLGSYSDTSSIKVGTGRSYSGNKNTNSAPKNSITQKYGRQSDYKTAKDFADEHFGGSLQAAKSTWRSMEK